MIQKLRTAEFTGNTFVVDAEAVRVPSWVQDLKTFRRWAHSDAFPETGRICYLHGEVWIDMSKEQFFSHNQVKQVFNCRLGILAEDDQLGRYVPDGMLLTNAAAHLSCQPDGAFILTDSFQTGRVRLVEGQEEGFLELEGTPDMVLEIVSTGSVEKDFETLFKLYWQAGIPEYWLVDARGEKLEFDIFRHGAKGYTATRKQGGWLKSKVFGRSFRLTREVDSLGHPKYTLEVRGS
jgi:Uma2 family endonuclease